MAGTKRGWCAAALLGLLAIACWLSALSLASWLTRQYDGLSVRYTQPAVTQKDLLRVIGETPEGELHVRAAWTRDAGLQTAGFELGTQTQLRRIQAYGDMRAIAPMQLLSGAFPVEDDAEGCLIDAASAWTLFHSTDATGAKVMLDDREYIIRGVAEMYEPAMMIRSEQAAYENLEFAAQDPDGAKQSLETFLYRCGNADDYVIVQSGLAVRVVRGAVWLPLWIAAAGVMAALVRQGWKAQERPARRAFFLAAGIVLGTLLCWGVVSNFYWPQSFLPTKWSDFSFWGKMIDTWRTDAKACALMTQLPKEIELFSALRRCMVALIVSILSGGWCVAKVGKVT